MNSSGSDLPGFVPFPWCHEIWSSSGGQGRDFTAHLQDNFNDIWADFKLHLFNDCVDCNTPVTCPK